MLSVSIIGAGRLAYHLAKVCANHPDIDLKQIFSRSSFDKKKAEIFPKNIPIINNFKDLTHSEIFILAVSDNAIEEVSSQIPYKNTLIVHTSGNTHIDRISNTHRKGVFYPIQSFSWEHSINWKTVPICLEAEEKEDRELLKKLASTLSEKIYFLDSLQRKKLHIACVFANNFTNHLIFQSQRLCKDYKIPQELISPLIENTFEKLQYLSAYEAQSGPALREDSLTIQEHTDVLSGMQKEIYKLLTQSIIQTYAREKL